MRRTVSEFATLLGIPDLRPMLARRRGYIEGYLLDSGASHKLGLLEAAGDPDAIAELLHHALARRSSGEVVTAYVPICRTTLGDVLNVRFASRRTPTDKHMMLRINDPYALFLSLRPWLERCHEASPLPAFSFELTDDSRPVAIETSSAGLTVRRRRLDRHLRLSRRALAAAIFGSHAEHRLEGAGESDRLPTEVPSWHFPLWMLDHS